MQYNDVREDNVRTFLPPIALCAATLIVYVGAFLGDFHYDDSLTILENPHLVRLAAPSSAISITWSGRSCTRPS